MSEDDEVNALRAEIDQQVEKLGEALFLLSDSLRASGFLCHAKNHRLYENVVTAFRNIGWDDGEHTPKGPLT